jgi:hypothetical protein
MLDRLSQFMRNLVGKPKAEPQDPYAYVGAPVRRGPRLPSAAVALDEPEAPLRTRAIGRADGSMPAR